jgi:hypothetical protein
MLRLLGMIDDENLHWAFLRFQFQAKLLLECCSSTTDLSILASTSKFSELSQFGPPEI